MKKIAIAMALAAIAAFITGCSCCGICGGKCKAANDPACAAEKGEACPISIEKAEK